MYPIKFKTQALTPFNRLMEDFFDSDFSFPSKVPVNIKQKENGYGIELAAPGFNKEDFKISVENKILKISAEHKTENIETNENYTRREFSKSSFERSFSLPQDIKEDEIVAKYENGILTIDLTKKEEVKNTLTISVQ